MALAHPIRTTTLAEDQLAALALARLNRQVKTFQQGRRAAYYELKQRYLKALYQKTAYVVGVWHVGGMYEFHIVIPSVDCIIDEDVYVFHQLPQEIDYLIQCGGQIVYEPQQRRKPLTANEWKNCFAAVEAWLIEIGVQP